MGIKINKYNAARQLHGYWENSYFKSHYYNSKIVGFEIANKDIWKCHYIDNNAIGCKMLYNSQYFYKTPGKKFGEEILWK